jgi:hypothetical protein
MLGGVYAIERTANFICSIIGWILAHSLIDTEKKVVKKLEIFIKCTTKQQKLSKFSKLLVFYTYNNFRLNQP